MKKSTICLLIICSLILSLFSCKNTDTEPNGLEAVRCNGHALYISPAVSDGRYYHKYVSSLDDAFLRLNELGQEARAIKIDYQGDDAMIFYEITATNANNESQNVSGFLQEGISNVVIETYIVLKDSRCPEKSESSNSSPGPECFVRLTEGFSEIEAYLTELVGTEDFAIIKIFTVNDVKIENKDLLTIEQKDDSLANKKYSVYYGADLAFNISSCVTLDENTVSLILDNLVYVD